jgi:hypothetical protein
MKSLLIAALVLVTASSAFAEDRPIAAAANRAAASTLLQGGNGTSGNRGLFWAGIGMMAGGTTLAILGNTALRREECLFTTTLFICVDEPNRAVWATGVALSATGGIMTWLGTSRSSIQMGPDRVTYRVRW